MYDRYESTDGVDNAGPFSGIDEFTLDVDLNDRYDKRVEVDHIGLQAPSAVIGTVEVADGEEGAVTWADLAPYTMRSGWLRQ